MSIHKIKSAAVLLTEALLALTLAACSANSDGPTSTSQVRGSKLAPPSVSLSISPDLLKEGQSAVATWDSDDATSCIGTGAWGGAMVTTDLSGVTVGDFTTPGTYTFTISCVGPGGSAVASQIVTVGTAPAPTVQFNISPAAIAPGSFANITWSSTNATSCSASGGTGSDGWAGSEATSNIVGFNTGAIATSGQYTYALSCAGPGGSTEATRLLTVNPSAPPVPPTLTFAAQSTLVTQGQATTFTWSATGATSCAASGGTGFDNWKGAQPVSSTGTSSGALQTAGSYSYTLTCTGSGGVIAQSATVVVGTSPPPVTVNIDVTPTQITAGGSAFLNWLSTGADSCVASGSWSGSQPLLGTQVSTGTLTTPGVYSFNLTCTGVGGSASGTAALDVSAPAASVVELAAMPTSLSTGASTTLAWLTANATSCTGSGGTGSDNWTGAQPTDDIGLAVGPFTTAGTYIYTLDCAGPGGVGGPASVSVVVSSPAQPAASITTFAARPSNILVGQSATLNWMTAGASSCTASGGTGSDGWNGSVGAASAGTSTGPINTAGSYTYTLTCTGSGGSGVPSSVVVNVNNALPAPATVTSFTLSPSTIQAGQASMLTWSTSGATACTASGGTGLDGWSGAEPTSSTGLSTGAITIAGTYNYILTCTGPGGTSQPRSAVVNVTSAPTSAATVLTFTATPQLLLAGQAASLAWSTSNATACTASGGTGSDGWGGSVGVMSAGTSTGVINIAGSYTYTLMCSGAGGSAGPSSVSIVVTPLPTVPPSIIAFTVLPSTIQVGQSAVLSWLTSGATSCTASGGTGSDGWNGTMAASSLATSTGVITTANSFTYTLTCTGPGGTSTPASVVLNVNNTPPPPATITVFAAAPTTIQNGLSTLLTWASIGSTSCTASGGSGSDNWSGALAPVGTLLVGPLNTAGNFTYTLTCTGAGGPSAPLSVTVDVNSIPPAPTINSFTVSPLAVQTGQSVTATWSSSGATSCTASGGTGSDGWSGTVATQSSGTNIGPVSIAGLDLYILTCVGPGGSSLPSTASVVVTATPPPASVASFSATPIAIQVGQSVSLAWTSSNATSCSASGGTGADGWNGTVATSSTATSTGVINTAGIYTYILTCTGAGGTGTPGVAVVTVSLAPPVPSVTSFFAAPSTLQIGQSTSFTWTTNGASACTAGGGTGSDGWGSSTAVTGTGVSVGPFNTAGTYIYTLLCTGPGGIGLPASLSVTVVNAPPAATIAAFAAVPTTLQAGQSTVLSWSSTNATSCSAGGGSGSDGWSGTMNAWSSGDSVGPLSVGIYVYTLTCTGPGGPSAPSSVSVTVTPATPAPPTVTLLINGSSTANIQPGGIPLLSWSTSNAISCIASGGAGGSVWIGPQATAGSGVAVGAINVAGTYAYTLTCAGPGGTGSSTATVTVTASTSFDCDVPNIPTTALTAPAVSVTTSKAGVCLLDCTIASAGYAIDSTPSSYATMSIPLGVAGTLTLGVDGTTAFPAGRKVGFVVANGSTLLDAALLNGVTVQTLLNGTVQESATTGTVLTLQAAGQISIDTDSGYAEFTTTKPFDSVRLVAGALLSLDSNIKVYGACVSLQ